MDAGVLGDTPHRLLEHSRDDLDAQTLVASGLDIEHSRDAGQKSRATAGHNTLFHGHVHSLDALLGQLGERFALLAGECTDAQLTDTARKVRQERAQHLALFWVMRGAHLAAQLTAALVQHRAIALAASDGKVIARDGDTLGPAQVFEPHLMLRPTVLVIDDAGAGEQGHVLIGAAALIAHWLEAGRTRFDDAAFVVGHQHAQRLV